MKTPSVLAFERKLDPSDALFAAGKWDDWAGIWTPVVIHEKSVRGTISNRLPAKAADPAKLNASVEKPNLQTIDVASLPEECDTLRVRFTLRILGGVGRPSACNSNEYQQKLADMVAAYRQNSGFGDLALRYALNVANGRFLWRNRLSAEQIHVEVRRLVKGKAEAIWRFDALALPTNSFEVPESSRKDVEELAGVIASGLSSEAGYCLLEVTAFVRMGNGQEVFPSQELILDKGANARARPCTPSRTLPECTARRLAMPCAPLIHGIRMRAIPLPWNRTVPSRHRAWPIVSWQKERFLFAA